MTRGQLRRVGEKIAGLPGVEKVILFGSYARGNPTPDSDVDLLVIWKTRRPPLDCRMRISGLFLDRSFPNEFSVQYRYPGEKSSTVYAKRALKAIKEVRKFFALHLPGISETR